MTNRPPPLLQKWPFILADVGLLVACAWVINLALPNRTTWAYVVTAIAILAWMGGTLLCVWPWIVEFKALTREQENDTLTDALQQLKRLEEVGARVQTASASWQSAHDSAMRVTTTAREIEEKIKADAKDFMEFAERINNDEKQHLRLEMEKLRRNEAEWLQVAARMLDHTFALTQAALRSGQPNLAAQMTNFQNACRDAARRVGLAPFQPEIGDAFDERTQQLEDANAKPEEGSTVAEILATGFTFQGQLLRKALVRLSNAEIPPQATEPVEEAAAHQTEPELHEETALAEEAEQVYEETRHEPEGAEETELAEEPMIATDESVSLEALPHEGEEVLAPMVSEEASAQEASRVESPAEEPTLEEPRSRRQRKPDPQTSLPL